MTARRCAIYARISVSTTTVTTDPTEKNSGSVERQVEAARQYAAARGWQVVAVYIDDGISATHNKPEDRAGWRALLDSPETYDAVLVWKIDRLARRVLDFLHADEALQQRGAGIVAVEDPVDMTTAQGRAFATLLAVFGEMEAEAIRARVKAARTHLIKAGRVVGGTVPYGWRSVENPDGPGFVLTQDPDRIGYVREMAERALKGATVYSIVKWLDAEGAPLPKASQKTRKAEGWSYGTVERLLRSPVLAGMTPYQPGRQRHEERDPTAVLRDENGLPVVDESVAILTLSEHRRLVALLDDRDHPRAQPRAGRGVTSPLLAGLVVCGHCDAQPMHRGTTQGRPSLSCPKCGQTISRNQLDPHVAARLLDERGSDSLVDITEEVDDNADALAEIEAAIQDTSAQMTRDDADVASLLERLSSLKDMRTQARQAGPRVVRFRWSDTSVREAWEACQDDTERREVLAGQVETIAVVRGKVGRYLDPSRVFIQWRTFDEVDIEEGPRLSELP